MDSLLGKLDTSNNNPEKSSTTKIKNKKYYKVRDNCHYTRKYRGTAHNVSNLRHKTPKEIPIAFHNGSKYNYNFIIKELAEDLKDNLNA